MSDVLNGLGTTSIYKLNNNWIVDFPQSFINSFKFNEFSGTVQNINSYTDDSPRKFTVKGSGFSKEEEKSVISFFENIKGRYKRFWFPSPITEFIPVGNYIAVDNVLKVEENSFIFQGYERVCIVMQNGDMVTGKIISATENGSYIDFELEDNLGYAFNSGDVLRCSLLVLVRSEEDSFKLKYNNSLNFDFELKMYELTQEGSEA